MSKPDLIILDGDTTRVAVWEVGDNPEGGCYVMQGATYTDVMRLASRLLRQRDEIALAFRGYGDALASIARDEYFASASEAASMFQNTARKAIDMPCD